MTEIAFAKFLKNAIDVLSKKLLTERDVGLIIRLFAKENSPIFKRLNKSA